MYASPAWWGYTDSKDRDQIDRLIARMKRRGFLSKEDGDSSKFAPAADSSLFKAACANPLHVLSSLFPKQKQRTHNLRARVHNYELPIKDDQNSLPWMFLSNIISLTVNSSDCKT